MLNIRLTIEYDGTRYAGWQLQRAQRTIQGTIENTLRRVLGENIRLIASGRTDAGVHALAQVANFKTQSKLPPAAIKRALNANLPEDIAIRDCRVAPLRFNARFDARLKIYRYTIYNGSDKIVIGRQYAFRVPYPLDIGLMKQEAGLLVGRKNFKSFHKGKRPLRDFTRQVKRIDIRRDKDNFIFIDISANGFLYNMARNIVGTLVEVARGKMPAASAKDILKAKDRRRAGPTMPARGLCLMEVKY